jgi:hypothetical protein
MSPASKSATRTAQPTNGHSDEREGASWVARRVDAVAGTVRL